MITEVESDWHELINCSIQCIYFQLTVRLQYVVSNSSTDAIKVVCRAAESPSLLQTSVFHFEMVMVF